MDCNNFTDDLHNHCCHFIEEYEEGEIRAKFELLKLNQGNDIIKLKRSN